MGKYAKILLQVLIAYIILGVLSQYLERYILILILILIICLFIIFGNKKIDRNLLILENECDVEKYIKFVNENLKDEEESKYLLYLTYGNLYNGNFEAVEDSIIKIDTSKFKPNELMLYEEIKLKLLYNNKDIIGYENKWDEISKSKYGKKFHNDLMFLRAPMYLMKEEYTELIDLLFAALSPTNPLEKGIEIMF